MISSGNLDRRITIQRATASANSLNEPVESWTDLATVYAMRRDVSDGEKLAGGQVGSMLLCRFTVRSSVTMRTVTPVDRIVHEGAIWAIQGVKEANQGRYQFIEITAAKDGDL